MSIFWQSVFAIFAAVGAYSVLRTIGELIVARLLRSEGAAELTLYGDSAAADSEQLLRAALSIRKRYLPAMTITFIELGEGNGVTVARRLAARHEIVYLGGHGDG